MAIAANKFNARVTFLPNVSTYPLIRHKCAYALRVSGIAGRSPDVAGQQAPSSSEARPRKRKAKIETTAERIATITVTVRPARENHQAFLSLVEI